MLCGLFTCTSLLGSQNALQGQHGNPIYQKRKLRLSWGNDTSKNIQLLSDHAGIRTWVFQVSIVPHGCCGLSCVGLETRQERSKVRRKAEGHGPSGTHLIDARSRLTSRAWGRWAQSTHPILSRDPFLSKSGSRGALGPSAPAP